MNIVRLTDADRRLLSARFGEHDNSHRRMRGALVEAGAQEAVARLDALRRLERSFEIDLGAVCHRFDRRDLPGTHPIEKMVVNFIAEARYSPDGAAELWVNLDHVARIRELMESRLVGEPES